MRIAIIAAVVLVAGCERPPEWHQMQKGTLAQARARNVQEVQRREAYASSPVGQADLSCQTKVQFAMAGHRARNILDLEGMAKANQMHESCMDYWRRTGQMP